MQKNAVMECGTFVEKLHSSQELLQNFINFLTVTESYFFRETKDFDLIVDLVRKKFDRRYQILSLPSSSGEEAYTLLVTFFEKGIENFELVGMDINTDILQVARQAFYHPRKVTYVPSDILAKYFETVENCYRLKERYAKLVTFIYQNIFSLNSRYEESFDIVLCRNLFIYFDEEKKQEALYNLHKLLKPKGYLLLGHADIIKSAPGFEKVEATLLRKL